MNSQVKKKLIYLDLQAQKKLKKKNVNFYKFGKKDKLNKFFKIISKKKESIFIIICNGSNGKVGKLEDITLKSFINSFNINFFSVVEIIIEYLKNFKNQKKKIIVFSGGGAFSPFPRFDSYATSKTALVRLVENLSEEYREDLQINAIAPGFNFTNIHKRLLQENSKKEIGYRYYNFLIKNKKAANNFPKIKKLIKLIFFKKNYKIRGKTISVNFDGWEKNKFIKNIRKINNSNYLTLKRVNR